MKSSVIEVGGLLSSLSARGVERQLRRLPGVARAEVNYVAGSATVEYDEAAIHLKTIKARVHECGYHCSGALLPKHLCEPEDPPAEAVTVLPMADHAGHAHPAEHTRPEHAAPSASSPAT